MIKSLYAKFIGGGVGNGNLITSTEYKYDDETFEYLGASSLYDGGEKANINGYYSFENIKEFLATKGKTPLDPITDNRLS